MNTSTDHDNRDIVEMNKYLEARVEALKNRITELEAENELLRAASTLSVLTTDPNGHAR